MFNRLAIFADRKDLFTSLWLWLALQANICAPTE
jgi:hypothetical protein